MISAWIAITKKKIRTGQFDFPSPRPPASLCFKRRRLRLKLVGLLFIVMTRKSTYPDRPKCTRPCAPPTLGKVFLRSTAPGCCTPWSVSVVLCRTWNYTRTTVTTATNLRSLQEQEISSVFIIGVPREGGGSARIIRFERACNVHFAYNNNNNNNILYETGYFFVNAANSFRSRVYAYTCTARDRSRWPFVCVRDGGIVR